MRLFVVSAVSFGLFVATPAWGESAGEAIKAFGLIGLWSVDCAREDVVKDTYALSPSGAPTMTSVSRRTGQVVTTVREIRSAVRVGDDKIKYMMAITKVTRQPDDRKPDAIDSTPEELLVQRFGSSIRVMQEWPKGEPKPVVEDGIATFIHVKTPLKQRCTD